VARLVFITGGTGDLGRHVIPALVDAIEHPPDEATIVEVPEMKR